MSENEARALARKAWNAWRKESNPKRKQKLLEEFLTRREKLREVRENARD